MKKIIQFIKLNIYFVWIAVKNTQDFLDTDLIIDLEDNILRIRQRNSNSNIVGLKIEVNKFKNIHELRDWIETQEKLIK